MDEKTEIQKEIDLFRVRKTMLRRHIIEYYEQVKGDYPHQGWKQAARELGFVI